MHRVTKTLATIGLSALLGAPAVFAQAPAAEVAPPTAASATTQPAPVGPYYLHLPGIGGFLMCDHWLLAGLRHAGISDVEVYDWTEHDPGLHALHAPERNKKEAKIVADKIAAAVRAHPGQKIEITSHSGGGAVAVWALEMLPDDVKIDTLVMLAPALSPTYDLTVALRHVAGHVYVFSSDHDNVVLGAGTKMFGTMDGQKVEAAGKVGFTRPDGGDPNEYLKLIPRPYDDGWTRYGNWGDHIGPMAGRFVEKVVAPLLSGANPAESVGPTTQPAAEGPLKPVGRGQG